MDETACTQTTQNAARDKTAIEKGGDGKAILKGDDSGVTKTKNGGGLPEKCRESREGLTAGRGKEERDFQATCGRPFREAFLSETLKKAHSLHFVGIGGVSMSSLALLSRRAGYAVSGSDRRDSPLVEACRQAGCRVTIGHAAENTEGADAVIYSAAISPDSPELREAERRGLPLFSRAEFLGELMTHYGIRIGVSGTHGKTTTTSMLSHIFLKNHLDPTVLNGAVTKELGGTLHEGGRRFFLYEACEYKASFLHFHPTIAVITNIEWDHTDFYRSPKEVIDAFAASLAEAPFAVLNHDDENVREAAAGYRGRTVTFSLTDPSADLYAKDLTFSEGCARYTAVWRKKELGPVSLPVIGAFNAANSLAALAAAALAVGEAAGIAAGNAGETGGLPAAFSPEGMLNALSDFEGAHRRFEIKYQKDGVTVADDYAHHPSEIAATLHGARALSPRRILTVFQPHTYSRTHDLFDDFAKVLSLSDRVILADIYAARETDTRGVSSALLAKAIGEKAVYGKSFDEILSLLLREASPGDLILTMGAGDIGKIGDALAEKLAAR